MLIPINREILLKTLIVLLIMSSMSACSSRNMRNKDIENNTMSSIENTTVDPTEGTEKGESVIVDVDKAKKENTDMGTPESTKESEPPTTDGVKNENVTADTPEDTEKIEPATTEKVKTEPPITDKAKDEPPTADTPESTKESETPTVDKLDIDNIDFKTVEVDMPVRTDGSGLIEGEFFKISITVPSDWEFDKNQVVFIKNGLWESHTYIATLIEGNELPWTYKNPEKAVGHISHEKIKIDNIDNEVLLVICSMFPGKENIPPEEERRYSYRYTIPYGEYYIDIGFSAIGKNNTDALDLQKRILSGIKFI